MRTNIAMPFFKIIFAMVYALSLDADIKKDMLKLYNDKKYVDVCKVGFKNFQTYKDDEEYVSLYAFGCLYADYIDRLTIPVSILKYTKEARANSAYLSIVLMQKKLLYHALIDGYDIFSLNLPSTDYILSKVFDHYVALKKHKTKDFYIFEDKDDKDLTYKLYLQKGQRVDKIVIEKYHKDKLVKKHLYW